MSSQESSSAPSVSLSESAPLSPGLRVLRGIAKVLVTILTIGTVVGIKVAIRSGGPEVALAICGAVVTLGLLIWFISVGARLLSRDAAREFPSKSLATLKLLCAFPILYLSLLGLNPDSPFGLLPAGHQGMGWSLLFAVPLAIGLHCLVMGTVSWMGSRPPVALRVLLVAATIGTATLLGPIVSGAYRTSARAGGSLPLTDFQLARYATPHWMQFSGEGARLLCITQEGDVETFSVPDGASISQQEDHARHYSDWLSATHVWPDLSCMVWIWGMSKELVAFDAESGQPILTVDSDDGETRSDVCVSDNGKWLAMPAGSEIRLWNLETGEAAPSLGNDGSNYTRVLFLPNGTDLVSADFAGNLKVWSLATGTSRAVGSIGVQVWGMSVSADGKRLALCPEGLGVHVWDLESGQELQQHIVEADDSVFEAAITPDGRFVASVERIGAEDNVILWDVATGNIVRRWSFGNFVDALTISADGRRLATASDYRVKVWDITRIVAE